MAGISAAVRAAGAVSGGTGAAAGGAAGGGSSLLSGSMGDILGGLASGVGDVKKEADDTGKSLGGLGDILGQTRSLVGGDALGFGSLLKILPGVGLAMLPVTAGLVGLEKGVELFNQFTSTIQGLSQQYVQAFAPAEAALFTEALRDMNAVIGEQLLPVVRAGRDVVRFFADTLAGLTPVIRGLVEGGLEAVRPLFEALGEVFTQLVAVVKPFFQVFADANLGLVRIVADALTDVARGFALLLNGLREFLGLPEFKPDGLSKGKAFARTGTTSAEGLATKLQTAAFAIGGETVEQLGKKQVNLLDVIKEKLANLPDAIAKAAVDLFEKSPAGQALVKLGVTRENVSRIGDGAGVLGSALANNVLNALPRFDQRF